MSYDFNSVVFEIAPQVAGRVGSRYRKWGIEREDCLSEIHVWLFGKGKAKVERWLASDPQQTTRIRRSMEDVANGYAEIEKAQRLGYSVDDVAWYSTSLVKSMLPLVLDADYDCDGVIDSPITTSIVDIRRALGALPEWVNEACLADDLDNGAVAAVVNYLGGRRPSLGSRKVLTNASAVAITGNNYDD